MRAICCLESGESATSVPCVSSESVAMPSFTRASYTLSRRRRYGTSAVAPPRAIGTTPCAIGSSVPTWPTFNL